jgi:hypothetical protein
VQSAGALLNVIVRADFLLADQPETMVIGVDADGVSYLLEEGGTFTTSNSSFSVVRVSVESHALIHMS